MESDNYQQQQSRSNAEQQVLQNLVHPQYVMGYRGDFKNNIFFLDDQQTIVYPAGHNIVQVSYESKESLKDMKIMPGLRQTMKITTMTISDNKRFLAYSLESEPAIIIVVDLVNKKKKPKTLTCSDIKSSKYISLLFRKEEEKKMKKAPFLLSVSGAPEHYIVIWNWEKATPKIVATQLIQSAPKQLYSLFSPPNKEDDLYCLVGNGFFKIYKYLKDQNDFFIKAVNPFSKTQSKGNITHSTNYLSYCFVDQLLILGTDQGEILLINQNLEYNSTLKDSPGEGYEIEVIVNTAKGFITGGTNGTIYIFEKPENEKKSNIYSFQRERSLQYLERPGKIMSMALDNDEHIIFGMDNFSLLKVSLNLDQQQEAPAFTHVIQPFHTDRITGLDTCIRKNLVATCSSDKTVRVWNYLDMSLEAMKEFEEPAFCLAFHPNGYQLIVSFTNKIKLLNIILNDENEFNDIVCYKAISVKKCEEIKYSPGGQFFAICNGLRIQVYETYTGMNNIQLKKQHTSQINTLWWYPNAKKLLSGGNDGCVYEWLIREDKETKPLVRVFESQGPAINQVFATLEEDVYSSTTNENIYKVNSRGENAIQRMKPTNVEEDELNKNKFPKGKPIVCGANIQALCLTQNQKYLFMGINEQEKPGNLRVSYFPLTTTVHEIQPHYRGITKMIINQEDSMLFTAGEDGTLIVYSLREPKQQQQEKEDSLNINISEDFFIKASDYKTKLKKLHNLDKQIHDLKITNQIMMEMKQKQQQEQVDSFQLRKRKKEKEEKEKHEKLMKEQREMIENFTIQKQIKRKEYLTRRNKIEDHFAKQILQEKDRMEEIQKDIEQAASEFDEFCQTFEKQKEKKLKNKRNAHELLLKQKAIEEAQILKEMERIEKEHKGAKEKIDREAEINIDNLRDENDKKLVLIQEAVGSANLTKNAKTALLNQKEQCTEEQHARIKEIIESINSKNDDLFRFNKEEEQTLKDIQERRNTIDEKTERINELKKKKQELQKFRYVLNYKIKELKRDKGPREEQIAKMKEQLNSMNQEILHFQTVNNNLGLIVADLQLRQKGMENDAMKDIAKFKENEAYLNMFKDDLQTCYNHIGDKYKVLKKYVLELLYQKYLQNENKKQIKQTDYQQQQIATREHLEQKVKRLKTDFGKAMKRHKQDNKRIMKENVQLLQEINELKMEKMQYKLERDRADLKKQQAKESEKASNKKRKMLLQKLQMNVKTISDYDNNIQGIRDYIEMVKSQPQNYQQQQQVIQDDGHDIQHHQGQQEGVIIQQEGLQ